MNLNSSNPQASAPFTVQAISLSVKENPPCKRSGVIPVTDTWLTTAKLRAQTKNLEI